MRACARACVHVCACVRVRARVCVCVCGCGFHRGGYVSEWRDIEKNRDVRALMRVRAGMGLHAWVERNTCKY